MAVNVQFFLKTESEIAQIEESIDGAIYFTSDGQNVYRGDGDIPKLYAGVFVSGSRPGNPVPNKPYIIGGVGSYALEMWINGRWETIAASSSSSGSSFDSVTGMQKDDTLDPVLVEWASYIILNASSLHDNFGDIYGLEDNDIVTYDGTKFYVSYDASEAVYSVTVTVTSCSDRQWTYSLNGAKWGKTNVEGFKPVLFWDFNSDNVGDWTQSGVSLGVPGNSVTRYTSSSLDPLIYRDVNFNGGRNQLIKIRYKVISGSDFRCQIFYATSSHGFDANYYKSFNVIDDSEWNVIELDMSDLTQGGTDWIDSDITVFRVDLGESADVIIDIDWITIGKIGWGTQYFEEEVSFDGNITIGGGGQPGKLYMPARNLANQIKLTGDSSGIGVSVVNTWANSSNAGVVVGSSIGSGVAFRVQSSIPFENGLPSGSGVDRFIVNSNGSIEISGSLAVAGVLNLNTIDYTWPSSDGTNDYVLTTNGAGTLTWSQKTGGAIGTITSINGSSESSQSIIGGIGVSIIESGVGNYIHTINADLSDINYWTKNINDISYSSGNVSIGSSTASELLSVGETLTNGGVVGLWALDGDSAISDAGNKLQFLVNVNGGVSKSITAELKTRQYVNGAKNTLDFYVGEWNNNNNSGSSIMTIQSDGTIGINKSSPTSALDIDGTIETSSHGSSSNWSAAYLHSQNNSQAHSDYLINNGNDVTSGTLTASGFIKSGGTASQFLKANGSVDSNSYLTSFTETDPIYTASSWYSTSNNSSNWNTAYGWGDWEVGVTKSFIESKLTGLITSHTHNYTNNVGTVISVAAGDGMTQTGTSTINPTLNVVSHGGTSGSIGTLNVGSNSVGVNLGTSGTVAAAGNHNHSGIYLPVGSTYNDVSPSFYSYGTPSANFTWVTSTYPNAYVALSADRTMTLTGVSDGSSGVIRVYAVSSDRTLTLSISGYTKYIDGSAPTTSTSGELYLSGGSYYMITFQAISSTIFFNTANYNVM